jgi:hypothetical protein
MALELEFIWNELARALPFFMVCRDPIDCFQNSGTVHLLPEVAK